MEIMIRTHQRDYPIHLGRGVLSRAGGLIPDDGRRFIVTEQGVPSVWKDMLRAQLPGAEMYEFSGGESAKTITTYSEILAWLTAQHASRRDIIVALGGGVTGDMAGFAAATYMRGIRYVNIPTTLLSQVDSSIGGKTAIDHAGIKNIAGAFWQPSAVLIDPGTLETLPGRELACGLAEAVKSGMIRDRALFGLFERSAGTDMPDDVLEEIILRSLSVKKAVVEADEREAGERKLLNYGHTIGHAYESYYGGRYLHGECVAMGMMAVTRNEEVKRRLGAVLEKLGLPAGCDADPGKILELIRNDKKAHGDTVDLVLVDEIGRGYIETVNIAQLLQ